MNLLVIIVILGLAYFLLMLPARRRRAAHASMQDAIAVGDEIITAGGLHGHVAELEDEHGTIRVEIAAGVVVTLDRRAVAAVARDVEVEVEPDETGLEAGEEPAETPVEPS
jgi:preprotein translocase subunit YajC